MRLYSEKEQSFINQILCHPDGICVAETLTGSLWGSDGIVLFLLEDKRICLFTVREESEKSRSAKLQLFSLLALMESLEHANMIYGIDLSPTLSLFMDSEDISLAIDRNRYTFAKGSIEESHEGYILKDVNGKALMTGEILAQSLGLKMQHFLTGKFYPTSRLQELVNNGFKSLEIMHYEKERKDSRKSLIISWLAFAVAVLSFCLEIPISNRWGKSTITSSQYEEIIKSITSIHNELHIMTGKQDSLANKKQSQITIHQ